MQTKKKYCKINIDIGRKQELKVSVPIWRDRHPSWSRFPFWAKVASKMVDTWRPWSAGWVASEIWLYGYSPYTNLWSSSCKIMSSVIFWPSSLVQRKSSGMVNTSWCFLLLTSCESSFILIVSSTGKDKWLHLFMQLFLWLWTLRCRIHC
jgi:hypothetical protein